MLHRKLALGLALLALATTASGQDMTEAQARALIAPWYGLFNQPVGADVVKSVHERLLSPDYRSCWSVRPGECGGRDQSMKVVANFARSIPDMKFDIKEVLVTGNRVIVRGEVSGTPSGDLFGVPHSGKSFRIMAIDIQTIRDGKIARTYHLENLAQCLGAAACQVAASSRFCAPRTDPTNQAERRAPPSPSIRMRI